jgi:hypothetical protein
LNSQRIKSILTALPKSIFLIVMIFTYTLAAGTEILISSSGYTLNASVTPQTLSINESCSNTAPTCQPLWVRIILKNVKNPTRLSANYATTSFGIGTATSQGYKIDYSNTSKYSF